MGTLTPSEQVQEIRSLLEMIVMERKTKPSSDFITFLLINVLSRVDRLAASEMPYTYQPDAKTLIRHAMTSAEDELGIQKARPVAEELLKIFWKIRNLEDRGQPTQCGSGSPRQLIPGAGGLDAFLEEMLTEPQMYWSDWKKQTTAKEPEATFCLAGRRRRI